MDLKVKVGWVCYAFGFRVLCMRWMEFCIIWLPAIVPSFTDLRSALCPEMLSVCLAQVRPLVMAGKEHADMVR